jgi:hypothetical protein
MKWVFLSPPTNVEFEMNSLDRCCPNSCGYVNNQEAGERTKTQQNAYWAQKNGGCGT